ncbi:hypothetical protein [Streptomyces sp. KL116D]
MVTDHIAHLTSSIDDLLDDPASSGIEEITIALARAWSPPPSGRTHTTHAPSSPRHGSRRSAPTSGAT